MSSSQINLEIMCGLQQLCEKILFLIYCKYHRIRVILFGVTQRWRETILESWVCLCIPGLGFRISTLLGARSTLIFQWVKRLIGCFASLIKLRSQMSGVLRGDLTLLMIFANYLNEGEYLVM